MFDQQAAGAGSIVWSRQSKKLQRKMTLEKYMQILMNRLTFGKTSHKNVECGMLVCMLWRFDRARSIRRQQFGNRNEKSYVTATAFNIYVILSKNDFWSRWWPFLPGCHLSEHKRFHCWNRMRAPNKKRRNGVLDLSDECIKNTNNRVLLVQWQWIPFAFSLLSFFRFSFKRQHSKLRETHSKWLLKSA